MLTFTILSKPCSVNKLYLQRGRYRLLSPAGRLFKLDAGTEIMAQLQHSIDADPAYLASLQALSGQPLTLHLAYHSATWLLKDGKSLRKKDIESYAKATNDTLFSALQQYVPSLDDSQVFQLTLEKIIDTKEYITLILS